MTTEYLFRREMEHVFAALTPANRLVCRVCLHTGLRVGDVVRLETAQIAPQFYIREEKTGKLRRVNLTRQLLQDLHDQAGAFYVFEGRLDPSKHRTRQAVWHDVKRAARAFRIPSNVGVHTLRKMYAVEAFRRYGGDVRKVQRLLNHSDAVTTMLYVMADQVYRSKYGDGNARA